MEKGFLDPEMVQALEQAFEEEKEERLQRMEKLLLKAETEGGLTREGLEELYRHAHSLKGSAAMVEKKQLSQAAHQLEDIFGRIQRGTTSWREEEKSIWETMGKLSGKDHNQQTVQAVKLKTEKLEILDQLTGELLVLRYKNWERTAELSIIISELQTALAQAELQQSSLRQELQQILSRARRMRVNLRQDNLKLSMTVAAIHDLLRQLQMISFGEISNPLLRGARGIARELGKEVKLIIEGEDALLERMVLEELKEVLLHLIRNALDHGIETPEERIRLGKEPAGQLLIKAENNGSWLQLTVQDDGRGIDTIRLRQVLEKRGLLQADQELAPEQLYSFLFRSGVSTREQVTQLSGRGVGLDVVASQVARLRGKVWLNSSPGLGTAFYLSVPFSLSSVEAVVFRCGRSLLACPNAHVERVQLVTADSLHRSKGRYYWLNPWGEKVVVMPWTELWQAPAGEQQSREKQLLLILSDGIRKLALVVDSMVSTRDIVINSLPESLPANPLLNGVAILENGEIVQVLVVRELLDRSEQKQEVNWSQKPEQEVNKPARRVLVVDDSITTRTLLKNIVEVAGYQVLTASDGEEAWQILQKEPIDLVVSDVEMPRVDGLTLTRSIRREKRLAEIPVILVTSRATPEQREEGLAAGATAYIVKKQFDHHEMLRVIASMLQ